MEQEAATALLKGAYELGYTHFDSAEAYSTKPGDFSDPEGTIHNECQIGKFLQTLPREKFTVATKYMPGFHDGKCDAETVAAAVDASLERLGLSYIDLYYCHRMPASVEALEEWMASVKALVEAGKVKHIGLSEVGPVWLRRAHAVHPVACIQQEWNLCTRNLETVLISACKQLNVGIVAYSPLARSLLGAADEAAPKDWRAKSIPRYSEENFEKNKEVASKIATAAGKRDLTAAQASLAWLYAKAKSLGISMVPIPGTTKLKRAEENAAATSVELTAEEMKSLEELGAAVVGARGNESYVKRALECQETEADPEPKIDPAPDGAIEMKVTKKKPSGFYVRAASSFLKGVEAKPAEEGKEAVEAKAPVENLRISGLGDAVNVAVTAAAQAQSEGFGIISRIQTAYPSMESSGRGCIQIFIDMKKK